MSPLFPELLAAHRTARRPELAETAKACGLSIEGGPLWGFSFVEPFGRHYAPIGGGKVAAIIPLFEDGVLLDLIATSLETRASLTRCGVATVLGGEWLDHARDTETAARLFPDPVAWLRSGRRGAVIVDWRAARFALADLPGIACETEFLAAQVERALKEPARVPRLFVREAHRAAA